MGVFRPPVEPLQSSPKPKPWRDCGSPVKKLPLFSNLLCPIPSPLNLPFHMERHIGGWVTPSLVVSISLPLLSNSSMLTLHLLPLLLPMCATVGGNYHHQNYIADVGVYCDATHFLLLNCNSYFIVLYYLYRDFKYGLA